MREQMFDTPVQFRAPAFLVAAARDAARRDGRTLSEVLRASLRSHAGRTSDEVAAAQ